MKSSLVSFALMIALSACASSPTEITSRDSRGGIRDRYYTSSDFCGQVVEAEKGFAVFAVEKGTSLGGNRLLAWLYNLGGSELKVRVHTFSYHGSRIFVRKDMTAAAGSKVKILDQSVTYETYGTENGLRYNLSVSGVRETGLVELQHQRHPDQSRARRACIPPDSGTGF